MRTVKLHVVLLWLAILLVPCPNNAFADNAVHLAAPRVTASADLGTVTFSLHLLPSNVGADAGIQLYVHHHETDTWDLVAAKNDLDAPIVFNLFRSQVNDVKFTAKMNPGTYDSVRLLLFNSPDGKAVDYGHVLYDSAADPNHPTISVSLTVTTSATRVTHPSLDYDAVPTCTDQGDGMYTVTISGHVKVPKGYSVDGGGFWAMAKGSAGFAQVWAALASAAPGDSAVDDYRQIPVTFQMKDVKPGLYNTQFGIFKQTWGDALEWSYPGLDFEVGGDAWVVKAAANKVPPRINTFRSHFVREGGDPFDFYAETPAAKSAVPFVRGGNYGNAICNELAPKLDTPAYFSLLHDAGLHFVRVNFSADRYPAEPVYQHALDQTVQNIWSAGLYPLLAPQDLPKASTLAERVAQDALLLTDLSKRYAGQPVWIELCNEPSEYGSWAEWKPVAERLIRSVRSVDPGAFVVVPFESWSKDGRGAAADPIMDQHVDLYDGHAYVTPADVDKFFGPATRAGLPLLIGEYGGTDPAYLHQMDVALQSMRPAPVAVAPWAFTVAGDDQIPLVASGDTAVIHYTAAGQAIANDFATWDQGKALH
jgi:hypothetical protein